MEQEMRMWDDWEWRSIVTAACEERRLRACITDPLASAMGASFLARANKEARYLRQCAKEAMEHRALFDEQAWDAFQKYRRDGLASTGALWSRAVKRGSRTIRG